MTEPTPKSQLSISSAIKNSSIILLEVGAEPVKYYVHEALLSLHSDYFSKALDSYWREGEERRVYMTNLELGVANVFVDWLYTQRLPNTEKLCMDIQGFKPLSDDTISVTMVILKVYVFADRFLIPSLKSAALRLFQDYHSINPTKQSPHLGVIIWAYENLPQEDIMLKFLINAQCRRTLKYDGGENTLQLCFDLPHEFLARVIIEIPYYEDWERKRRYSDYFYHDHSSISEKNNCPKGSTWKW
ncbi:hypothetical protein BS50DRAFT_647822 [Corynespora cassiicola Philippines]|uniref:BTB domain-containing protein n=1 Tax=Corynespora cassiicola Philippines TaxID=1448308 RepID=A0A2T2NEX9_CORCC|nr:hypothetical protein BS50DRAFT_647822 [Corynespora cassiicola Philippines]